MKNITLISTLLLSGFLFSCSKDPQDPGLENGRVKAVFTAGIDTRAQNAVWDIGDRIGITMLDRTGGTIHSNVFNYPYYTATTAGSFIPVDPNHIIYFPQDGGEVTFRSYYPYNAAVQTDLVVPVSVADQQNLPAIDFMSADHQSGFSRTDPTAVLRFHHRLSKVIFRLNIDAGVDNLTPGDLNLVIKGMERSGSYNLFSEALSVDAASGGDISVPVRNNPAERVGIVLPRPAGAGVSFELTAANGSHFVAQMPETLPLNPGFQYVFNLELSGTEMNLSVSIEDWADGPTITYNLVGITTPGGANIGVLDGEDMNVYMTEGTGRTLISTYTYNLLGDLWTPSPAVNWESVPNNPVPAFYASILRAPKQNATQLDDYLIADPVAPVWGAPIAFTLKHAASKVAIQLRSSDNSFTNDELLNMTILLPSYEIGGDINNGLFEYPMPASTGDVTVDIVNNNATAIIRPQTLVAGQTVLRLTEAWTGNVFNVTDANDIQFEAGKMTTLIVDLQKTAIGISAKVEDWTTSNVNLTANKIQVGGTLEATSDFFKERTIYLYQMGTPIQEATYSYQPEPAGSTNYQWKGSKTLYWDDLAGDPLSITGAYYPLISQAPTLTAGMTTFPWNLPNNQSTGYDNYDLLMDHQYLTTPQYVNFDFKHVLSKVRVVLVSTEFTLAELQSASVIFNGFVLNGTASLATGNVTGGSTRNDIIPFPHTNGIEYSALVMPQTMTAGRKVVSVIFQGNPTVYQGTLSAGLQFLPGNQHLITVTLKKTKIELSATLEPWTDGDEGEITIQ